MADNIPNTPGAQGPESEKLRSSGKELLDNLKQQLRLEGDYRDILRDSVRELQKAIKQHDTINAKLEAYSIDTINIKQVQTDINNNLVKQYINKIKLNDITKKLGGLESDQVKIADEYLKALDERSSLEDKFFTERSKFINLENKLKSTKKEEFDNVQKYLDGLEEERKLQEYIAKLNTDALNLKNQSLTLSGEEKFNVLNKISAIEQEAAYIQETGKKLQENLDLKKQSFTVDQQEYLNAKNIYDQANEATLQKEQEISTMQQGLNLEQAAYIEAKKTNELYESNNQKLKQQEEFEKRSQSNAGILGKLVGGLANKFGLAEQVQKDMVIQQKKLAAEALASGRKSGTFYDKFSVAKTGLKSIGKGIVENFKTDPLAKFGAAAGAIGIAYKGVSAGLDMVGNAASAAGNFIAGMSKHSGTIVRDLTSGISSLLKNIPLVGGLLGGLVEGFAAVIDLMLGVDDYAVKMGRQLNMGADAARGLAAGARAVSAANGDIFITNEKILESQVELASTLGVVNNLGGQIVAKNIKLKDFAGLELETRSKLAQLSKTSGKDATNAILAQVRGIQKATGIAFQYQDVLREASSQSGYLGLQFAKYPAQMTKTLLTVKAMGMELKQVDAIADSLLDFESSISKEFEAQLLTGKEINLTKAREAFLNNDLATAAAEITKQVGSTEDFLKLNRIQADSLASSFGMSRDQLGDMLKQQEFLAKIGAKQGDNAREQLRLGLEKYKTEEALSEAIGEQAYQSMVNASTQEKLAATIEKIKESIVKFVMDSGLFEKVKEFIDRLSNPDTIRGIIAVVRDTISTFIEVAGEMLADIVEIGGDIADTLTPFSDTDYSEQADIFAAKVRAGSLQMSKNVRGDSAQYSAASVEGNAAKEKVGSSSNSSNSTSTSTQPDMSMATPTNVKLTAYLVDHKRDFEQRNEASPNVDTKTGTMGKKQ